MLYREHDGILHRELERMESGVWVIQADGLTAPKYVDGENYESWASVMREDQEEVLSKARKRTQERREKMLAPLIEDRSCIWDKSRRIARIREAAAQSGVSERSITRFYYAYLAKGAQGLAPAKREVPTAAPSEDQKKMEKAINAYYYSSMRMSLPMAYEMMLLNEYRDENGELLENRPSYGQFRYLYEKTKDAKKRIITRNGIGVYRKDCRPLLGTGDALVNGIGTYEMDATVADIYVVSKYDRQPIGRPNVYLAVDVASRLIAGIHVSMKAGSESVLACLANAASDKTAFCRRYGIHIKPEAWPSAGLPNHIWTDRGTDFTSDRIMELCEMFHMEVVNLPAYRPDLKGFVEKAFDILQNRYKPLLLGKGVVEKNPMGRRESEYWKNAELDLDQFTKVLIQCVLYYNAHHVLNQYRRLPGMLAEGVEPIAANLWAWYAKEGRVGNLSVNEDMLRLLFLPREQATMTRKGLAFRGLYYINDDFLDACISADEEREKMNIAYDPDCNDVVYLIQGGGFVEFWLTPACRQYRNLSFPEVELLLDSEKAMRKSLEGQQLAGGVACNEEILKIAAKNDHWGGE